MEGFLNNVDKYFKYSPQVGDRVKIIKHELFTSPYLGKFGKVKSVNRDVEIAEVEVELELFSKKMIQVYFEELQLIRQPLLQVNAPKNLMEIHSVDTKEEFEPVELDHLCMPTTQDKVEPIDKGEVVEEIGKFVSHLKSKGWQLGDLSIELYNQDDEEDYVIVHL